MKNVRHYIGRNPHLDWQPLEDDIFVFSPGHINYYRLGPVDATIWKLSDGSMQVQEVACGVYEQFADRPGFTLETIFEVIEQLISIAMLYESPAPLE